MLTSEDTKTLQSPLKSYDYMRLLWARVGTPYSPDINAKLGTKWTYMIILACWSQVVAGTNYKGYVAGDGYDCAHVVIFKPLGDGKPEVKEAFKVMD